MFIISRNYVLVSASYDTINLNVLCKALLWIPLCSCRREVETCDFLLHCPNFASDRRSFLKSLPTGNYMFKVSNRNTRTGCEICSKLTITTPERPSGVFIINFEHISHLALFFLLLTLNMYLLAGLCNIERSTLYHDDNFIVQTLFLEIWW